MQIKIDLSKLTKFITKENLYTFLFGMLGAMFVLTINNAFSPVPKKIATVNITKIIKQFTQEEAKKELSPEIINNEVKDFVTKLEKNIKSLAISSNLILVPSEAIIFGCDDYTREINQMTKGTH